MGIRFLKVQNEWIVFKTIFFYKNETIVFENDRKRNEKDPLTIVFKNDLQPYTQ